MYTIKTQTGGSYTIPKVNLYPLALSQAIMRGVERGPIHDEKTAKEYLESIGFIVEG